MPKRHTEDSNRPASKQFKAFGAFARKAPYVCSTIVGLYVTAHVIKSLIRCSGEVADSDESGHLFQSKADTDSN